MANPAEPPFRPPLPAAFAAPRSDRPEAIWPWLAVGACCGKAAPSSGISLFATPSVPHNTRLVYANFSHSLVHFSHMAWHKTCDGAGHDTRVPLQAPATTDRGPPGGDTSALPLLSKGAPSKVARGVAETSAASNLRALQRPHIICPPGPAPGLAGRIADLWRIEGMIRACRMC